MLGLGHWMRLRWLPLLQFRHLSSVARMSTNSPMQDYYSKYFESAASGDIATFKSYLKGIRNIDWTNDNGWSALMFAARNNRVDVVKALLQQGCDVNVTNKLGQTAADIADFWGSHEVRELLQPSQQNGQQSTSSVRSFMKESVHFGCGSFLDRLSNKRKDTAWVKSVSQSSSAIYVLFHELSPLMSNKASYDLTSNILPTKDTSTVSLLQLPYELVKDLVVSPSRAVVFLGEGFGRYWFAVDVSDLPMEEAKRRWPAGDKISWMGVAFTLGEAIGNICCYARSLLAWHDRYKFCATCGGATTITDAGHKRTCNKADCRSNQGVHNTCHPRLDPSIICAVLSPDGSKVLLGRTPTYPRGMWTCLSGFIEAGESVEEACRREVHEESGIRLGRVVYHSSQSWPMPGSLLVGFVGYATSTEIMVDKEEMEDVRWFSREECQLMLDRRHPQQYWLPPDATIAHHLVRAAVNLKSSI